jgi:hypothetical protein
LSWNPFVQGLLACPARCLARRSQRWRRVGAVYGRPRPFSGYRANLYERTTAVSAASRLELAVAPWGLARFALLDALSRAATCKRRRVGGLVSVQTCARSLGGWLVALMKKGPPYGRATLMRGAAVAARRRCVTGVRAAR